MAITVRIDDVDRPLARDAKRSVRQVRDLLDLAGLGCHQHGCFAPHDQHGLCLALESGIRAQHGELYLAGAELLERRLAVLDGHDLDADRRAGRAQHVAGLPEHPLIERIAGGYRHLERRRAHREMHDAGDNGERRESNRTCCEKSAHEPSDRGRIGSIALPANMGVG